MRKRILPLAGLLALVLAVGLLVSQFSGGTSADPTGDDALGFIGGDGERSGEPEQAPTLAVEPNSLSLIDANDRGSAGGESFASDGTT